LMCFDSVAFNQRKSIFHAMIIWIHTWITHSASFAPMRSPQRVWSWEAPGRKPVSSLWDAMGPIVYGSMKEGFGWIWNLLRFGMSVTQKSIVTTKVMTKVRISKSGLIPHRIYWYGTAYRFYSVNTSLDLFGSLGIYSGGAPSHMKLRFIDWSDSGDTDLDRVDFNRKLLASLSGTVGSVPCAANSTDPCRSRK
jgi:hypothetical protein